MMSKVGPCAYIRKIGLVHKHIRIQHQTMSQKKYIQDVHKSNQESKYG